MPPFYITFTANGEVRTCGAEKKHVRSLGFGLANSESLLLACGPQVVINSCAIFSASCSGGAVFA